MDERVSGSLGRIGGAGEPVAVARRDDATGWGAPPRLHVEQRLGPGAGDRGEKDADETDQAVDAQQVPGCGYARRENRRALK